MTAEEERAGLRGLHAVGHPEQAPAPGEDQDRVDPFGPFEAD